MSTADCATKGKFDRPLNSAPLSDDLTLDAFVPKTPAGKKRGRRGTDEGATTATPAKQAQQAEQQSPLDRGASGCVEVANGAEQKSGENKTEKKGTSRRKKKAAEDEGEEKPAKRARKPKPEGPYTKYKEIGDGSIPEPLLARTDAPPGREVLKVVSWNVGGLRAFLRNRAADLTDLGQKESPDVFAILEHKLQEDGSVEALSALQEALPDYTVGPVSYSTVKKGYSGVLVMLRKGAPQPDKADVDDLTAAAGEGRLVVLEYTAFFVVLCYVPNSGDGLVRLEERIDKWDVQLREKLLKLQQRKPVLLVGDLNAAHLDLDIWNVEAPHVAKSAGTTPQERGSFGQLLDAGFVDGFRHRHPDALGAFTYWSVRANNRPKNKGLRLDYAVVSKRLADETSGGDDGPSLLDVFHMPERSTGDHCPIGVRLCLPRAAATE